MKVVFPISVPQNLALIPAIAILNKLNRNATSIIISMSNNSFTM